MRESSSVNNLGKELFHTTQWSMVIRADTQRLQLQAMLEYGEGDSGCPEGRQ